MLSLCVYLLSSSLFLDLHLSESLRLKPNLILHFILLLYPKVILSLLLLILLFDHFCLFSFLLFLKEKSILNFFLFIIPLFWYHVIILAHMSLLLIFQLNVKNFLYKTLNHEIHTYLLNFLFISLFEALNIISSLLSFFNLLPCFHFFLFQKSNTISQ